MVSKSWKISQIIQFIVFLCVSVFLFTRTVDGHGAVQTLEAKLINRVIPMTDEVYEILQNQKIKQTEQKMWKHSIWKQHKEFQNLVFTCSDGSPVYYYNVNSAIKDYVAKINVIEIELAKEEKREPKIFELFTCHTLRHTYATRCYENGVDQQVVQKLLGHSILAMTTDLYTHVSEEKKKEEVAELKILA